MKKQGWLLYDHGDLAINGDFVRHVQKVGESYGIGFEAVCTHQLLLGMDTDGKPYFLLDDKPTRPDLVLSRQRDSLYSIQLEKMGIPVLNGAMVCETCNDKRKTHQFLQGLPMPRTLFFTKNSHWDEPPLPFPFVLKPAKSHGGDRIFLIDSLQTWNEKKVLICPEDALCQTLVSDAGKDLRVYVVDGNILAGVMRQAKSGIVSNYKQGGSVSLHVLTPQERDLANAVIKRFEAVHAHLWFVGIDFLYDHGMPIIGEVEDVVGSRMLYQVSDIDIVERLLQKACRYC